MKTYKEQLESLTKGELRYVRTNLKKYIEKSILSLVGLTNNGHGYEIDHCNGNKSVLTDVFRAMAVEEATKIAKNYKPTREDMAGYDEAFKAEVRSQMRSALREVAKEKAKEVSKKLFEDTDIDLEKVLEGTFDE